MNLTLKLGTKQSKESYPYVGKKDKRQENIAKTLIPTYKTIYKNNEHVLMLIIQQMRFLSTRNTYCKYF